MILLCGSCFSRSGLARVILQNRITWFRSLVFISQTLLRLDLKRPFILVDSLDNHLRTHLGIMIVEISDVGIKQAHTSVAISARHGHFVTCTAVDADTLVGCQ